MKDSNEEHKINLCVTHDVSLFLVNEYYLERRLEENPVEYLDGVIIYKKHDDVFLVDHQGESKKFNYLQ